MKQDKQVLFVAGLGATGSSALIDLLKEVNGFFSMGDEFRLIVDPGGLISLRNALVNDWSIFQSDMAIRNFKKIIWCLSKKLRSPYAGLDHSKYFDDKFEKYSKEFIEKCTYLNYNGLWYGIDNIWIRNLNKYKLLFRRKFTSRKMYVGENLDEKEYDKFVNEYLLSLVEYTLDKEEKRIFCFNENLSCMFPDKIKKFMPKSKMILLVRDPKDVYSDTLRTRFLVPPPSFENYIKWQEIVYNSWLKVETKHSGIIDGFLKIIRFEDLILNYDKTIVDVFSFLGISEEDHVNPKAFLDPEISKKNIGLWKNILSDKEVEDFNNKFSNFYSRYNYQT